MGVFNIGGRWRGLILGEGISASYVSTHMYECIYIYMYIHKRELLGDHLSQAYMNRHPTLHGLQETEWRLAGTSSEGVGLHPL